MENLQEKGYKLALTGHAHVHRNEYELAERRYTEAIELDPTNENFRIWKAQSLERQRKWDDALREYDRLLELFPDDETAWRYKARWLNRRRFFEEAEMCAENALRTKNCVDSSFAWLEKGFALGMQHNLDEAMVCYDELIRFAPSDGWTSKGDLFLFELCDYENAIRCFDNALKMNEKFGTAWNGKGIVYWCMGLYEEAIKCYDYVLADVRDKVAWTYKGVVLTYQGKYEEAEKCFQAACSVQRFADAFTSLGYLHLHQSKFQEALNWFEKALTIEKEEEFATQGKALCEYLMSNPRPPTFPDPTGKSLQYLSKFNQTKLFFDRGITLLIFGELGEAKKAFQKCLELNPKYRPAAIELDKAK